LRIPGSRDLRSWLDGPLWLLPDSIDEFSQKLVGLGLHSQNSLLVLRIFLDVCPHHAERIDERRDADNHEQERNAPIGEVFHTNALSGLTHSRLTVASAACQGPKRG
jgi:hypothetical protein